MTAAAIAPRTTPPAKTDSKVFFKEGVIAASAASGLDRVVIKAAVAVADTLDWKIDLQIDAIKIQSEDMKLGEWSAIHLSTLVGKIETYWISDCPA
jgi:hypothetical protein